MASRVGVLAAALAALLVAAQPAWARWLIQTKGDPLIQEEGHPEVTLSPGLPESEVKRILGESDGYRHRGKVRVLLYPARGLEVGIQDGVCADLVLYPQGGDGWMPAKFATDRGSTHTSSKSDMQGLYPTSKRIDLITGDAIIFLATDAGGYEWTIQQGKTARLTVGRPGKVRASADTLRDLYAKQGLILLPDATASAKVVEKWLKSRAKKVGKQEAQAELLALGFLRDPSWNTIISNAQRARSELAAARAARDRMQYVRAAAHYKVAVALAKGECGARKEYAQVLGILGRDAEAGPALRHALECRPRDAELLYNYALNLRALGRHREIPRIEARLMLLDPALASELRKIVRPDSQDYTFYEPRSP